ncbi:EF-hand calcium-binding domain-containing protein 11 [Gastrophryne carolinensis]
MTDPRVTATEAGRFQRVFAACDEGEKGFLSREDLKVAMVMLFGYKPSKMEVDAILSSIGRTEGVHAEEFVKLMSVKRRAQLDFGQQREIFSAFDVQCRGFLTVDDFKRAFKHAAPHLPEHTALQAFREVDRDSDGLVCYKDFEFALSYGTGED